MCLCRQYLCFRLSTIRAASFETTGEEVVEKNETKEKVNFSKKKKLDDNKSGGFHHYV